MENTEKVQKEVKKQPTWKKVINIVLNVLFYTFIVFMLTFAIANIASKSKGNIPNIFGVGFLNVETDSMEGLRDDSFFVGDLLIVKLPNEKNISALVPQENMITFYDKRNDKLITHRLVDIRVDSANVKTYITQGDKVAIDNPSAVYEKNDSDLYLCETITEEDIKAIYSTKWKSAGGVLHYLQSKEGFGLCIVLPTSLLLIFEGYVLVKNVMELNRQKLAKEMEEKAAQAKAEFDPEEEKKKIREQLMREMQAEKENKNTEDENKE